MFINMMVEDPEILINIINGDTKSILHNVGIDGDFNNLKQIFNIKANNNYMKPSDFELKKIKVVDLKIDEKQLNISKDNKCLKHRVFLLNE